MPFNKGQGSLENAEAGGVENPLHWDGFWYTEFIASQKVELGLRAKPKMNICVNAEVDP